MQLSDDPVLQILPFNAKIRFPVPHPSDKGTIMYRHVEYYPGDPILSLVETFKNDPRPEKVNLSIGIYFDDEGKMPVLESVSHYSDRKSVV